MGQVIVRTAAVVDILADVDTTLVRSRSRGGLWWSIAEQALAPYAAAARGADADWLARSATYDRVAADLRDVHLRANDLLGRVRDEVYNLLGRPGRGSEPLWGTLFPSGLSTYVDRSVGTQPAKMGALATLLEIARHPALPVGWGAARAVEIRAAADALSAAVAEVATARTDRDQAAQVRVATTRSAQTALVRTKRLWRGYGRSEADIHDVIPDRPARRGVARAAAAAAAPLTVVEEETADPRVVDDESEAA